MPSHRRHQLDHSAKLIILVLDLQDVGERRSTVLHSHQLGCPQSTFDSLKGHALDLRSIRQLLVQSSAMAMIGDDIII